MDTLEFLKTILPEHGVHYVAIFKDGYKHPAHKAYIDLETMAQAIVAMGNKPDLSIYHACGTYERAVIESDAVKRDGTAYVKREYRVPSNWARAKSFWMDIDCGEDKYATGQGYLTKMDGTKAVFAFADRIGWPRPMIVDSGNGIHAYWPLTKDIKHESWVKIATYLKAATQHFKLKADPTATADFARILRPVGAVNRKRDPKPVKVKTTCEPADPKELADALSAVVKSESIAVLRDKPSAAALALNQDLIAHLADVPKIDSSGELVAEGCLQVAAMRDTQGDVSYEHWRGVIGVLKHCVDGEALAEQWSSERDATGHQQSDWRAKFDTWNSGPATCEFFQGCNPDGCNGCLHKGKVKSPIMLGRIIPITTEKVVEVTAVEEGTEQKVDVTVPALPIGYQWDERFLSRSMPNKDGVVEVHAFSTGLFYPTMRIRKDDGTFNIGMRMHMPDNRVRDFEIPFSSMSSTSDLLKSFAAYELIHSNHKEAGSHMHAYMREAMDKLKREVEEVNTLTTYGWKYDMQAFLIGDRLYHKDGSVRRVLLGGYAAGKRRAFPMPRGTLEGYTGPLNFIYNRPGLEPMQYALCSGWGSILAPLCEDLYKGLIFSLYSGRSGTGKSTVCYNSLYAFGNAEDLAMKSEDMATKNALWATVGAFNNIPMLFDELTKIDPEELSAMAYRISLGEERGRLRNTPQGTRFADTATWRMSPFVTSNKDLHALLSMTQANAEAESVRVVQVNLDQYHIPELKGADLQAFQMACDQIKLNSGVAGDAMIRYVVKHVDDLYSRMRDKVTFLAKHISEPKFRFYRSHAACTLVMAEIAKELGVIDFDVDALQDFSIQLMTQLRTNIAVTTASTPDDAYSRLVAALAPRIIVTTEFRDNRDSRGPESPRRQIVGEVAGRFIAPHSGVKGEKLAGRMFLNHKDVRDWCAKNRTDFNTLMEHLAERGALVHPDERVKLTQGTDMPGTQVRCIVIDTLKLADEVSNTGGSITLAVNNNREDNVAVGEV